MSIISFEVVVDDLEATLARYDCIQVWRSVDQSGDPVPYVEVTSERPKPAIMDGTLSGPWNLDGTELLLSLSGADPVRILFSGTDPWNLQLVLNQINAVIPGLAQKNGGSVRLTAPISGTASTILITGSAASVLGLSFLEACGQNSRVALTTPTTHYKFRDFNGSLTFWYKTRFYSSKTKAASAFSLPRQGAPQIAITNNLLSKAYMYLADGTGRPVIGRRVIFVPVSLKTATLSSGVVYNSLPGIDRLITTTDDRGYAEMMVLRGAAYRVFFEGTAYHREFTVPNLTEFDLLVVLSTAPDVFDIVRSPPMLIRMSE